MATITGDPHRGPMASVMEEEQSLLHPNSSENGNGDDGDNYDATTDNWNPEDPDNEGLRNRRRSSAATTTATIGANVSSLDFERIVNQYSIQAVRDRWLLPPLPADGSSSGRRHFQEKNSNNGDDNGKPKRRPTAAPGQLKPQKRHAFGYSGRTATRWVLTAVAGVLTGMASILIVQISGIVVGWRSRNLQTLIINPRYADATVLLVFLTLNLIEAMMACWLCVGWVPAAAGSGIPAVKAYLNGIRATHKFTRFNLFVVKVLGTILSVSSGLAVGQEGPLIHIGAIMGSGCSKISGLTSRYIQKLQQCTGSGCLSGGGDGCSGCRGGDCQCCCWNCRRGGPSFAQRMLTWTSSELSHFATDGERRDLVSIGASCGFAASFGAPVGGLLFILDDISSYFSKNLILRILVANALGTFCLAYSSHDLSNYSVINLGTHVENGVSSIFINRVEEIPLYILVGVGGGVLGGLFCMAFMFLRRNITGRYPARGHGRAKWQFLEVAAVSILTSVLIYWLPSQEFACKDHSDLQTHGVDYRAAASSMEGFRLEQTHRGRFFCGEGQINELANMLFGSRIDAIKRILTDPGEFKLETLLAVGSLFYVLMTLTLGVAIPSGIFTPTVLIGAAFGGAAGMLFKEHIDPAITPSTFALLGVAALLAGIQRSTVSVAVILVEGTGQIKILTPAIITVVVARYVASLIYKKGVFEAVLEWKDLPYLSGEENKRRYDGIEVGDIMTDCPVESVRPMENAKTLVALLERSTHHGFPVIDPETKRFLGLVRRDQIAALLECGIFDQSTGNRASSAWARPQTGVEKSPLMRWAYHINDDRYEYILEHSTRTPAHVEVERAPRFSMISSPALQVSDYSSLPTEFATVEQNDEGNIIVSWLNPDYTNHFVNIGAVMNRGAFVVTEFCPVSKAYNLFTALGLRHLVVLGGSGSGGEVVGVLSRANLVPEYIKERTGL